MKGGTTMAKKMKKPAKKAPMKPMKKMPMKPMGY